jgi:hypothetical protein
MKQMATLAMRCMAEVAGRGEIAERCDEVRLSDVIHLSECPRDSEVADRMPSLGFPGNFTAAFPYGKHPAQSKR